MAKKEVIYQGLSDLNVLIDDTTANSPDYFRVTNLPGEFTAGINIFKFKGNPALFPEGSSVYIEVLDANGLPVYYEIGLDLESQEQSAIISVYINEDTVPGNGSITICGQANQSSSGQILDPSEINVRWSTPVYIDISKRNVDDIIFDALPEVTITATTGSYTNLGYPSNTRTYTDNWSNTQYVYRNGEAILYTGSLSGLGSPGFPETATNTQITIYYGDIQDANQRTSEEISTLAEFTSSISAYSGSGIAYLSDPIIFPVNNSSEQHIVQSAFVIDTFVVYEQSASLASQTTENTHNIAVVQFSGLQPQIGEIAKIRSYYKSAGVQEYIFSNETDISDLADEFGFTANTVTASFALPTIHRNDRFDFKFEFINPSGYVSKQVLEYRDVLFQGGNTYIGGDDNLITGSLYVAGATGTGVHISGKGNAAMIRSIGYEGFTKATGVGGKGGFVIYSGSVQPLLNATENYSGVGIELVANSGSYFKYKTANGGLLDIRTEEFFLGSPTQYISGTGGNIEISSSNFSINQAGNVDMSGDINAVNGIFQNATITGFVITGSNTAYEKASGLSSAFLLESWFTSSFVRNRASGNSTAALATKFATGNRFQYGIFGWTASLNLATASTYYSNPINPLGNGHNVAAASYLGGGGGGGSSYESAFLNPGAPNGFKKWKDEIAFNTYNPSYGPEYNGYGNEITTSFLGGNFACAPTVDTIVFLSPANGDGVFSITSSLIQIPVNSLGFSNSKYNADPIGLQFGMRMISGSNGGGGSFNTTKWSTSTVYNTFYVQCEILNSTGSVLLTDKRYVYGPDDWQLFNIPLTPALIDIVDGDTVTHNPFKIIISWAHSGVNDSGGRPSFMTITNLVRITELRLVQFPTTLGLKTDSIQFQDSYFSSGNQGTQHFGSITPTANNVYDFGIRSNQWKSLNAGIARLEQISLSTGIINPKYDFGGLIKPDSLAVYGGASYELDQNLDAKAFVVDYQSNTTIVNKVYIGQDPPDVQALNQDQAKLNVKGGISHALPAAINDFQGEINPYATTPSDAAINQGDIYTMGWRNSYNVPGEFRQLWTKASAASEASGSGLLGIGLVNAFSVYANQISGVGMRGIANFTGSSYQLITSASGVMPGDKLYLSTTPGKFQNWAPTGSGEVVRIIGYCNNFYRYNTNAPPFAPSVFMSTGSIYFAPETSWIQNV